MKTVLKRPMLFARVVQFPRSENQPTPGVIMSFNHNRRSEQLRRLYEEHGSALEFADRISSLVADGAQARVAEAMRLVREYYDRELEAHLQQEEQTLFGALLRHDGEHMPLCMRLGQDHGLLRTLVANLSPERAGSDLALFADTLREHTLLEERELLPLVETVLTEGELDAVTRFTPLPWLPVTRG